MNRKLIQLSPSTAVVSLPAAWLRKRGLKKGAQLELREQGSVMIVGAQASNTATSVTIDISALNERALWFAIDSAYTSGYDTIALRTRDAVQTARMARVVQYFPGMIIDEERARMVRFRDMTPAPTVDLDALIARISYATIVLLEEGLAALDAKDRATLRDAKRRDYHINSYVSLCMRHLRKHGAGTHADAYALHTRIKVLEMIADKACALLVALGESPQPGVADRQAVHDALALYRRASQSRSLTNMDRFDRDRAAALERVRRANVEVRVPATALLDLLHDLIEVGVRLGGDEKNPNENI